MDVIKPDEDEAIQRLRWLVDHKGFEGYPLRDTQGRFAALVYARRWTTRHVDVVIVEDAHHAQAYRASGVDQARPEDLRPVSLLWCVHGTVPEVVEAVSWMPPPLSGHIVPPRLAAGRVVGARA